MNQPAQQGHRYNCGNFEAIAMETGYRPLVRPIVDTGYGVIDLGPAFRMYSSLMEPLPMRYFHGATE